MSYDHNQGHGGAAHGSVKEYVVGLILSIVLTIIPFGAVMDGSLGTGVTSVIVILCCIAQVFVQMVFFLHMNASSSQIWNTTSGLYVVFIVLFLIIGSLWIFEHLNHNMLMGH